MTSEKQKADRQKNQHLQEQKKAQDSQEEEERRKSISMIEEKLREKMRAQLAQNKKVQNEKSKKS